jgi:hypothetical protein
MAQACTHLDQVEVGRPAEVAGCDAMFVLSSEA